MNPFGRLIQDWMDRTGQSLRALALQSGVDRTKISAYMTGAIANRTITPEQADAIAEAIRAPAPVVHEAVAIARGYKLDRPDLKPRMRILVERISTMDDAQLSAVESTAVAVSSDR